MPLGHLVSEPLSNVWGAPLAVRQSWSSSGGASNDRFAYQLPLQLDGWP